MDKVIFASNNEGKVKEVKAVFAKYSIKVLSMREALVDLIDGGVIDIEETGETYADNAYIKASTVYKMTGIPTIADDSGVEVDYLNNEPGIYTHRWVGKEEPCEKMLKALDGVPECCRGARYKTCLCYVADGKTIYTPDEVIGKIIMEKRGENGFMFDAIFVADGESETFGEMTAERKNKISARGKALRTMAKTLREL